MRLGEEVISRDWLYQEKFTFNLDEVLKNSLYYPASGFSGTMVELFGDQVSSFIHVDYERTKEELFENLVSEPFSGFKMIHSESVNPDLLVPNSWNFSPNSPQLQHVKKINPFCVWMVFENTDRLRFSLLHICAEGVSAYGDLYNRLGYVPFAIACQRSDGGSTGNWTRFLSTDSLNRIPLYEIVKANKVGLPKYLIADNSHEWDLYCGFVNRVRSLSIYSKNRDDSVNASDWFDVK